MLITRKRAEWYAILNKGSLSTSINNWLQWTVIGQMIYIATIVPIKWSICVALLRITIQRRYKYALYAVMFLALVSAAIVEITILTWCTPVSAQWHVAEIPSKCKSIEVITSISYFLGATSISSDLACAILPILIFWKVQLKRSVKVSLMIVLALGVL